MFRRPLLVLALSLPALGCRSRTLDAARAYERSMCGCHHHDVVCARAARDAWVDTPHESSRWYERDSWDELRASEEAGDACFDRALMCNASDPCDVGQLCVPSSKNPSHEVCVRVAQEGEPCEGRLGDTCAPGLECWSDDPLAHQGGVFDDPSCAYLGGGTCVKPASKPEK